MLLAVGGNTILVGLSAENVRRMQSGQPARFSLAKLGFNPPHDVVIYTGTTEEEMAQELQHLVGPNTAVDRPDTD